MPRRIFYGDYHNQKNKKKKKIIIAVIIIAILIIGAIVYLFLTDAGGIGQAVRSSVGEITQLKMQLQEKDDRIAELEQQVEQYKQELALRPAPSSTPIPPPNDQVAGGTWLPNIPTATQTPKPSRNTRTKKPAATKAPAATPKPAPTQAPAATITPPPATTVTQPPQTQTQPSGGSTGEGTE